MQTNQGLIDHARKALQEIDAEGLTKREHAISGAQGSRIKVDGDELINLCANNYLGLANDPDLINAAKKTLDSHGFGIAAARSICGTQNLHRQLETSLANFLKTDDAILFSSCYDANGGLFGALLTDQDAVISDALNHASIIDGIRLCKARRFRYANNDMDELAQCLKKAQDARYRLIVTDGVFSMDGIIANLPAICDLAQKYGALVVVDDSHAVGFMGEHGAGTPEHYHLEGKVDVLTGTLGKALGGASGGYIAGPAPIIELLRQKARPYLFSNSLAPAIVGASLVALTKIRQSGQLRRKLFDNSQFFRKALTDIGYTIIPGEHPIIPIMIGDAKQTIRLADGLMARGIYVTAFSFPVVARNAARIRVQMSGALDCQDLVTAINAFDVVGRELKIIK